MSIVSAFNDIAVAQGGTADTSGTLVGAIDALNDALAGSPQEAAKTIEGAINLLGENIGGGEGAHVIEAYHVDQGTFTRLNKTYCYPAVVDNDGESNPSFFVPNYEAESIDSASSGSPVSVNLDEIHDDFAASESDELSAMLLCYDGESLSAENIADSVMLPELTGDNCFIMPNMKVAIAISVVK